VSSGNAGRRSALTALPLALDGDTLTGEVYDITDRTVEPITGTVSALDDSIELSVAGRMATATLLRGANGDPMRMSGAWPGTTTGTFEADGCRLN